MIVSSFYIFYSPDHTWSTTLSLIFVITSLLLIDFRREDPIFLQDGKLCSLKNIQVSHGGTITGNIGMGKSTLRFHLLYYFKRKNYQIFDFDYKGETYEYLLFENSRIIPGRNCRINLFEFFDNDIESNIRFLTRLLISTSDELSPPQLSLLKASVRLTIKQNGNLLNFFDNIHYLGNQPENFGIYTEKTSMALFDRLNWLISDLSDVFNTDTSSFNLADPKIDLYFDLSELTKVTNQKNVKRFVDIVLQLLMRFSVTNKRMIFIEEVQILLNNSSKVIEEIITTQRHNQIGVFLCGTRLNQTTELLTESGTHFLFHSDNSRQKYNNAYYEKISKLRPFELILQSPIIQNAKYQILPFARIIKNQKINFELSQTLLEPNLGDMELRLAIFRGGIKVILPGKYEIDNIDFNRLNLEEFDITDFSILIERLITKYNYFPEGVIWNYLMKNADKIVMTKMNLPLHSFKIWIKKFCLDLKNLIFDLNRKYILIHHSKD